MALRTLIPLRSRQLIIIGIFFLSLFILGSAPLQAQNIKAPLASQGILDLRNWNFPQDGLVSLQGEWEFYWQEFLSPEQLAGQSRTPSYLAVPSTWRNKNIGGYTLPGDGFATYRLTILLDSRDNELKALKLPHIFTSYKLWTNGRPLLAKGVLGTSRETAKPHSAPAVVFIEPEDGKIDLVIQVANFEHLKGGLRYEMYLGTPQQIMTLREHTLNLQMLLLGSLLIIGCYYLVHYFFRRKELASLYFGLFCVAFGFRILCIGESALFILFPDFPWFVAKRLEYAILYTGLPLFGHFIYYLYPQYISRRVLDTLSHPSLVFLALALLGPTKAYMHVLPIYQTIAALGTFYYVCILFRAAWNKHDSALSSALAGFILLITVVNDILNYHRIIKTYDGLISIGIFVFIFTQAMILSQRFALAISQAEALSEENMQMINEICELNRNLEEKISQRTAQLKEIIEILNQEISERAEREQKLQFYATTDIMTGLANRATGMAALETQLTLAKRNKEPLTVGFVDIDNLKRVNDEFGHKMGDDLIVNISRIMQQQIRQSDTLSRIGGDEFLIVFPQCSQEEAEAVWLRIEEAIAEFNKSKKKPYRISLSRGFAQFIPGKECTAQELLEAADCQMYRLKKPEMW